MNKYIEKMKNNLWLNEYHLLELFKEAYGEDKIIHNRAFPGYKFRPDIRIEHLKLIVEFDGPRHYTQSKVCVDDIKKDKIYKDNGYIICRVPYFIQIRDINLPYEIYDKIMTIAETKTYYDYLAGFRDNNVILPANFCALGIKRFKKDIDLHSNSENFSERVWDSINDKILEHNSILKVIYIDSDNINHVIEYLKLTTENKISKELQIELDYIKEIN